MGLIRGVTEDLRKRWVYLWGEDRHGGLIGGEIRYDIYVVSLQY